MSISIYKEDIILVFDPKLTSEFGFVAASIYQGFNKVTKKGEYTGLLRTISFTDIDFSEINNTQFLVEIKREIESETIRLIQKNVIIFISTRCIYNWLRYPIYFLVEDSRKIIRIKDVQCISESVKDSTKKKIGDTFLYFEKDTLFIHDAQSERNNKQLFSPSGIIKIEKMHKNLAYVSFNIGYDDILLENLSESESQLRDIIAEQEILEKFKKTTFVKDNGLYTCSIDELYLNIKFLSTNNFKIFKSNKPVIVYRNNSFDISSSSGMDWFEISGDLTINQSTIPLISLARSLKNSQNWIEIENSLLLIPSAFKQLLNVSEISQTGIKVPVKAYSLLQSALEELNANEKSPVIPPLFSVNKITNKLYTDTFKGILRPYQEVGVKWLLYLHKNKIGGVLGDEMGLGKTIQAICAICNITANSHHPVLIISPKTLLFNWEKELDKFAPKIKYSTYHGQGRKIQNNAQVILSTYGTLSNDIDELSKIQFEFAIFDEAQVIKNSKTRNHKKSCLIDAQSKVALTGTPIENSVKDLWSIYHLVFPQFFGTFKEFSHRFSKDVDFDSLKRHISPVLLRRKKNDVLTDLPPKIIQIVYNEMDSVQQELYNSLVFTVKAELEKKNSSHMVVNASVTVLNALLRLRQLCCHPLLLPKDLNYCHAKNSAKFELFCTLLNSLIDQDEKVVVFSEFTSMLSIIEKYLIKKDINYQRFDGATKDRKKVVLDFETGDYKVLIISIKAGGLGINLTSAHNVILYDPWWNPAVENQAIDRLHRIGQKLPVTVYKLITANSIEEKIQNLQNKKNDLFNTILESTKVENLIL